MTELTLRIVNRGENDWQVWVSLPDHDPLNDAFGFIVGMGTTRNAAVADAVAAFEGAVAELQEPVR